MRTVFVDMDGVLADFDRAAHAMLGVGPAEYEALHGADAFWRALRRRTDFYATLPLMADARHLWAGLEADGHQPAILTGVPHWPDAAAQKRRWAAEHFPAAEVITCAARDKAQWCRADAVLIDDRPKYRHLWEKAGGVFIVHVTAADSLAQLRALAGGGNAGGGSPTSLPDGRSPAG